MMRLTGVAEATNLSGRDVDLASGSCCCCCCDACPSCNCCCCCCFNLLKDILSLISAGEVGEMSSSSPLSSRKTDKRRRFLCAEIPAKWLQFYYKMKNCIIKCSSPVLVQVEAVNWSRFEEADGEGGGRVQGRVAAAEILRRGILIIMLVGKFIQISIL